MEFIKLVISSSEGYSYDSASNIKMDILGNFLANDVIHPSSFINWAFNDDWGDACSVNITSLEKEDHHIILTDLYSEEETPTELKMTRDQFIKLLNDWEEKVCKLKPKEVIIKYENDEFVIETKN